MDVTKTQLIPLASTLVAVVLGRIVLGEELSPAGLAGAGAIPSVGLPLLMEFRSYPSSISLGLNPLDISLALNPLDLAGTYLSFITSPLHVPTRWIFEDKIPEDGSAVCEQYFDREFVTSRNAELRKLQDEEIKKLLDDD